MSFALPSMESGTESAQISDSHVSMFINHLQKYSRAPSDLAGQWRATQNVERPPSSIFLQQGGFTCWFAYILLQRAVGFQAHFSGKAECARLIERLEGETNEFLASLALQVSSAIPTDIERKVLQLKKKMEGRRELTERTCESLALKLAEYSYFNRYL